MIAAKTIPATRVLLLSASLCAIAALSPASSPAQTLTVHYPEYHLRQSDVLEVKFRYTPEFNQLVTINPDGRITLEATGTFIVADLTIEEFKARVKALATARLVEPEVSVVL